MKYFDNKNNRLVFISEKADDVYWDRLWQQMIKHVNYKQRPSRFNLYIRTTKKYLKSGSVVLEGGCGLAQSSWNFYLSGYKTIALDYTPKTIDFINEKIPEVNPVLGDVKKLPFKDGELDGYWSFGVIEHFYYGFDVIASEAARVVRKSGYLFLTFPHMSKIRRLKVRRCEYPVWEYSDVLKNNFYQFALDEDRVEEQLKKYGFQLVKKKKFDALGGWRRELNCCSRFLIICILLIFFQ